MTTEICGYLVLRKPDQNFDETKPAYFGAKAPCIDKICYGGIDRMAWFDLIDGHHAGTLAPNMEKLWRNVEDDNRDFSDISLLKDYSDANAILRYSNRHQQRNELAAVFSQKLAGAKGIILSNVNIEWLGLDIHCPGYGSPLLQGFFARPGAFAGFATHINENGLFDMDSEMVSDYFQEYIRMTPLVNLEPMGHMAEHIDVISVGRVN